MALWDIKSNNSNGNTGVLWGNANLKTADDWDKEWDEKHPTKKIISADINWDPSPSTANVNIPGFNINLNPEPVNVPQLMNRNYQPDELKKVGSKVAETIGNIPLNPVTYATNKIVDSIIGSNNADDSLRVKDLGRLSNAAIALGEKSDNFTEFLRNNAQPDNSIGGIKLPSTTLNLDFATYNKEQNKTKLNNAVEALKGKYEPNPLRLGMSEKQAAQFEKDNPTLAQVGKFGISAVVDPLNFVGLDLVDSLAKGSKVAKTGSKFADDIAELGVKELADKEKYLAEKMPGIQNYIDTASKQPTPKFTKNLAPIVGEGEEVNQKALQSYMKSKGMGVENKNLDNTKSLKLEKEDFMKKLPDNEMELEQLVKKYEEESQKRKLLTIDLQLFAAAKEKLQTLKTQRLLENRNVLNSKFASIEDIPDTTSKIVSSYEKPKLKDIKSIVSDNASKAYTRFIDNQYPITKFSNDAGDDITKMLASASRQSRGTVKTIIEDSLVNREGKEIGESFGNIYKDIPKGKSPNTKGIPTSYDKLLEDYMLHQHNIDRMNIKKTVDKYGKSGKEAEEIIQKPVYGKDFTPEMSKKVVDWYESTYPELKGISDRIRNTYDKFMTEYAVKGDLLPDEIYKASKDLYGKYVPTNRKFSELEKGMHGTGIGGNKFVNQKAAFSKAKGSSRDIISPLESYLTNISKTVKAVRNNEVMVSIIKELEKNPEGLRKYAEIIIDGETVQDLLKDSGGIDNFVEELGNQFDKSFNKLKGDNIVYGMVKGVPVKVKVNDPEFLRAIKGLTQSQPGTLEKFGRTITNPFKTVVTGKNPVFAVSNLSRDIPNAYINSVINNPVKYSKDVVEAATQMAKGGELWKEYKALGGEHANFFADGGKKLAKQKKQLINGKNIFSKAGDALGSANSATESLNRFAEYLRTVKQGGGTYESKIKGIYNAGEITTNFSRHGDITKAFDAFVPYLNPAVQGLDKLARQIYKKPLQTLVKGGISITAPTLLLQYMNKENPYYDQLDNRTKDTYYLIPNPIDKDNNGIPKTFIKIPKARELGVLFGALEERILRKAMGDPNSFKDFKNTVKNNFGIANPIEDNIFRSYQDLRANKDFADRTIVPQAMQSRSPALQYDEKTSELSKLIGKTANISPIQMDYLIKSLTGIIGKVVIPYTTKGTFEGSPKDIGKNLAKPFTTTFTADPLYSNQANKDFYENKKSLETKRADYKALNPNDKKDYKDKTLTLFNKTSESISKLYDQINKLDPVKDKSKIQEIRSKINQLYNNANKQIKP